MSYKDKPIIKLYKYENSAFVLQAIIDDFQEVSFEHNIYEAGTFTITINYNIPNALLFQRGLFVQFGNNPYDFGEIITIQDAIGQDGKGSQIRTITGRDARYILKRRVIKNMNSNGLWAMTDKGEIVLRNLIKDQCGIGAETKRQLPIANTIPASADAKGKVYSVSENFSNLYEVCKTIATQSEIGWRLAFNGTLTLEVFEGADLSQTVRFDTSYESLANGEFSDSSDAYSNAIYIGGKGQNDDRDIYEGEDGTPQGLDRFESWDNQSSLTVESEYEAEALSMLTQYGQTLTMNGNGLAKCPYVFREQYDIGDTVTVAFSGKSATAQILSITEHWTWGSYDISFSFGKPQNNLSDQLQLMLRKIQEASNKTNSTDSVRWYTIPTDTAMPKADVTYNTIGFVGTVGTGATFTLYLDDEKTGAKTYHVYFKQLGGTGKLTLTTGKAGATNLTLNAGTYVAIIYVDENGNITNTASTPTATIEAGSTQPVTSGGVANALALPTDAVLHYSFDEVPDYPDGSANVRLLNNNTYDIQSGNYQFRNNSGASFSNVNGNLQINMAYAGGATGVYITNSYITGKIIKMKLNVTALTGEITVDSGSGNHVLTISEIGKYDVAFLHSNTLTFPNLYIFCRGEGNSCTFTVEQIYIGDGSYNTPVIDNADGQNNATNNGGIAVQGVSGKGVRFLGNGYINGNLPWTPWDKQIFSLSCWIRNWDKSTNLYLINNWITFSISTLHITFNPSSANKIIIDVCIGSDLYRFNNTTFDFTQLEGNIFVACILNGTSTKLYMNGVSIPLLNYKIDSWTESTKNRQNFQIGRRRDSSSYVYSKADIDDFQIFDRALSEQEVQALYLNKANTPKYYSWADWKLSQV